MRRVFGIHSLPAMRWPIWPIYLLAFLVLAGAFNAWREKVSAERMLLASALARDKMRQKVALLASKPKGRPLPPLEASREKIAAIASLAPALGVRARAIFKKRDIVRVSINVDAARENMMTALSRGLTVLDAIMEMAPIDNIRIQIKERRIFLQGRLRG